MVAGHLQTKKGYYYMVLNLKSEDGNRKSKWISTGIPATGKKSAKLAEEMLAETRCTYKDAASPCAGSPVISREDISFSDYMIKWLGIIKNSVEVDTYAGYVNNIEKRIVPYFRGQRILLRELTALDVENFYSYCFNELHLKGTTVQRFHANIHKAMKYARKHDLIASNPMDNVERPKSQRYVGAFYSVSELETLFQAVKGDPCEFPVLMAAFYGLRRSEIMGLRWRAIDFENNLITIDHTVIYTGTPSSILQRVAAKSAEDFPVILISLVVIVLAITAAVLIWRCHKRRQEDTVYHEDFSEEEDEHEE